MPDQLHFIDQNSFFLEIGDISFWINPNFSPRLTFIHRRIQPLTIDFNQIKQPDYIIITDESLVNFDLISFKYINEKATVILPDGLQKRAKAFINNPLIPLKPNQTKSQANFKIQTIQAGSFVGGRLYPYHKNKSLSYALSIEGFNFLISPSLKMKGSFGGIDNFDFALLPVTENCVFYPFWFKKKITWLEMMKLKDRLQIKNIIPTNWGGFLSKKNDHSLKNLIQDSKANEENSTILKVIKPYESLALNS